jgi:hypothetical protein
VVCLKVKSVQNNFHKLYNKYMENELSAQVKEKFGLQLSGFWGEPSLAVVLEACTDLFTAFHLTTPIHLGRVHSIKIKLEQLNYGGLTSRHKVRLNPDGLTTWTVVHELGHAWDYANLGFLSLRMMLATHSSGPTPILHGLSRMNQRYWYHVGAAPAPCGVDQNFNRFEDFAEAVTAYVYPDQAFNKSASRGFPYGHFGYTHFRQTPRGEFIASLVDGLQKTEMALTP